ncbi:MAG: tRNA pseudouridine(55) synthase TruB [Caldilineaceae bacterium]|nr:tRNA pseudouridine(55) synthase TruB [Caldilineaceae bacterium]
MPKSLRPDLHGLLIVDKPGLPDGLDPKTADRLPTSHDIVQRVRRWSGQRRIGHTGTLDPMASGILILCLGAATRLVEYYQGHDKSYLAEIALGVSTATYDAMGVVVDEQPSPPLTVDQIEAALSQFQGTIEQKPPIYSALKQDGESLHRKARRGEVVEVAARRVTIHRLDLVEFSPPSVIRLRVHCSAGTYVRSLAHDLGKALGTVAHLSALCRETVGEFTLADAHSLDAIESAAQDDRLADLLLPVGERLTLPILPLDEAAVERLGFGQRIWLPAPPTPVAVDDVVQGIDAGDQLLGILRILDLAPDGEAVLCKADKWLAPHFGQPLHSA